MADVPPFRLVAPNLARGQGGVGGQLTDAETIEHNARRPAAVTPAVTAEYGHYLAQTGACLGCL